MAQTLRICSIIVEKIKQEVVGMKKLLWTPSAEQKEASVVNGFMKFVNERNGSDMNTYEELYDWSVTVPV